MNILYSKTSPVNKKEVNTKLAQAQLFSLAEDKLEEGLFEAELYGIVRSALLEKKEDRIRLTNSGQKTETESTSWFLLLGLHKNKETHKLNFRVCKIGERSYKGNYFQVLEEGDLSQVISVANKHMQTALKKNNYFVSKKEFGENLFTEDTFWTNLEECLEDPDSFYEKRVDSDRMDAAYKNLRIPLPTISKDKFDEYFSYDLRDWNKIIKESIEDTPKILDYFYFQNPFFPQSLDEEEQAKLRSEYFYEMIKKVVTREYFEEKSELLSFYEKMIGELNEHRLRELQLKILEATLSDFKNKSNKFNDEANWRRSKEYFFANPYHPLPNIISDKFITKLLCTKDANKKEEIVKILLDEHTPSSYKDYKKRYCKKIKKKLPSKNFMLSYHIDWNYLSSSLAHYLEGLNRGEKQDVFVKDLENHLFSDRQTRFNV